MCDWQFHHSFLVHIAAATYDDLFNDLMEAKNNAESRYAVFDAEYKLSSGQQRTKLVFVFW